jgi:hypothetical protein
MSITMFDLCLMLYVRAVIWVNREGSDQLGVTISNILQLIEDCTP